MKVGVFTVLLADRPLEDALDYVKEGGCEAVEIGTGGYPGDAYYWPGELLQGSGARDKFRQAVENGDLEIRSLRTVIVTEPEHPYVGAWWQPGHIIGYDHTFVHTIKDLLDGIAAEKSPAPTF